MVSFQCSPLATAEGIVGTFKQCARLQKDKDLDKFVAVVVLDEVGLAEDSQKMPLKVRYQPKTAVIQDVQTSFIRRNRSALFTKIVLLCFYEQRT